MWFSNATCNPAAIHIDAEYCKNTEFGRPLVNSIFTLGLVIGLSVQDTTLGTTVANLGMTDTRFPKPGVPRRHDPSRTTVKELRDSKSRPNAGHRHLPAPGLQPARRGSLHVHARRR